MNRKYDYICDEICENAVIFARVSSEKQERGASIDAQLETIYDYCHAKKLNVIKEFTITESSMRGDRKQYHEMLKFVLSYKQKIAIVVNCVDRLQRSYKDTPVLDDLRKKGKIEVHFLKENLILSHDSRGMDILFWNMCVLMANSYVLSISDNVRRSQQYNWSQGKWQSLAPIGYYNIKDNEGKSQIVIDEKRAPIIKRIFQEYSTGLHTAESIISLVKRLGLTSKEVNHHPQSTNYKRKIVINRNTVYAILRNPFYYGYMRVKGKIMPHIHGNIIDKALFDKVQCILNERHDNRGCFHQQKQSPRAVAFRGLIRCGNCNTFMSTDIKTRGNEKIYTYFRCYHKCGQAIVNENLLFQQLHTEIFDKLYISESKRTALKKSIRKSFDLLALQRDKNQKNAQKSLDNLNLQEDKITDLFISGKVTEDIYNRKINNITEEKRLLKENMERQLPISYSLKETVEKTIDIIGNLATLMKNIEPEQKQELLNLMLKDCRLNNKVLSYKVKEPFNRLLNCKSHNEWKESIINNLADFVDLEYSIKMLNLSIFP